MEYLLIIVQWKADLLGPFKEAVFRGNWDSVWYKEGAKIEVWALSFDFIFKDASRPCCSSKFLGFKQSDGHNAYLKLLIIWSSILIIGSSLFHKINLEFLMYSEQVGKALPIGRKWLKLQDLWKCLTSNWSIIFILYYI